jgi:hypothetical protein
MVYQYHFHVILVFYSLLFSIIPPQVAITRARRGLIVVGNSQCLSTNASWASFLDYMAQQQAILPVARLAPYLALGTAMPDFLMSDQEAMM